MLLASREAAQFAADLHDEDAFRQSRLHQHAIMRLLGIVGEAANGVSSAVQDEMPGIPWKDIIGMRHRLIHGYGAVRLHVVWGVVTIELPALIVLLEERVVGDQ